MLLTETGLLPQQEPSNPSVCLCGLSVGRTSTQLSSGVSQPPCSGAAPACTLVSWGISGLSQALLDPCGLKGVLSLHLRLPWFGGAGD